MQISDIMSQLNRQLLNIPTEKTTTSTQSLMANSGIESLLGLEEGQIFEGVVTKVDKNQVCINLANGATIEARLEEGVTLQKGEATFFQVKSNVDGQIALKAVTQDNFANPTLLKALTTASLPVTEKNLQMVQNMMKQQLPIDTRSLQRMARLVSAFPKADVSTLVQLDKMKVPVNNQNIEQLEHYQKNQGKVQDGLEKVIKGFTNLLTGGGDTEKMISWNRQILDIMEYPEDEEKTVAETKLKDVQASIPQEGVKQETPVQEGKSIQETGVLAAEESVVKMEMGLEETWNEKEPVSHEKIPQEAEDVQKNPSPVRILEQISEEESEPLKQLKLLTQQLVEKDFDKSSLKDLFSSKPYKELVEKSLEQQWFLKPEELADKEKLKELYERLDRQMEKISRLLTEEGKGQANIGKQVANIRENLNFLNEVNHFYNYVQIPLKMANQNATGDLFVYTNKKSLKKKNGEISAHLHLEMEHLGTTDVYVRLNGKKLATNFVMEDEKALDLVMNNIDILTKRLSDKGYEVKTEIKEKSGQGSQVDFVKEILGEESVDMKVSRYSFDVKV